MKVIIIALLTIVVVTSVWFYSQNIYWRFNEVSGEECVTLGGKILSSDIDEKKMDYYIENNLFLGKVTGVKCLCMCIKEEAETKFNVIKEKVGSGKIIKKERKKLSRLKSSLKYKS